MAQITINISDNRLSDVYEYVSRAKNYRSTRLDAAETKEEFARRMLVDQMQTWVAVGRKMEIEEQINDGSVRQAFGIS
jgi:hypothetical protein